MGAITLYQANADADVSAKQGSPARILRITYGMDAVFVSKKVRVIYGGYSIDSFEWL